MEQILILLAYQFNNTLMEIAIMIIEAIKIKSKRSKLLGNDLIEIDLAQVPPISKEDRSTISSK
jgi:hypothetical protein